MISRFKLAFHFPYVVSQPGFSITEDKSKINKSCHFLLCKCIHLFGNRGKQCGSSGTRSQARVGERVDLTYPSDTIVGRPCPSGVGAVSPQLPLAFVRQRVRSNR